MARNIKIMVWAAAVCGIILLLPVLALFAGTPEEKARAAVIVTRTRLELAKRAELPDSHAKSGDAAIPMQLTFESQATAKRIACKVFTTPNCIPCKRQKADNGAGDDRLSFEYLEGQSPSGVYPCTTYVDSTGKTRYIDGYKTTAQIWEVIQRNNPPQEAYAATGSGGAIRAKSQIQSALTWWRSSIGTGPVLFSWKRTGAQTFPLLHSKPEQWTFANVFGDLGEFLVSAPGSKLPVEPIILGYRRSGENFTIRPEITIHESRLRLSGDTSQTEYAASPAGFGPATILTIASAVKAIWELIHPHVDLSLGGTVSASCKLDDAKDELTIDFKDCPGVKISAWFEFELQVKQVVIRPDNIHLEFSGSRWVKSRDLRVE